ncbi:MAG TPA: glycosyltransferase family 39 protein [Caulobacteraceae bacterium]|nr:glycosyltransferase family 39 protein [Caulobacteraceae bacterium]
MSPPSSPSGEVRRRGPPLWLIALAAAILAARLAAAAACHLTEDEAYYRLWASAPALGYFDHPPMIAWWIWLGRKIAGDSALGVRLLPVLASAGVSFLVWDAARAAGLSVSIAARAAVWWNATLLVAAGGLLATPDSPASFFWITSLCCSIRALRGPALPWWGAAGVAAGLACLSKYSALFLAPGVLLWLLSSADGRRALRTPGPWLAAALALAIFSLNIAWNAEHGWLTFAKQFGRVEPHRFAPQHLAELALGQVLLLNPLIAAFLARGVARGELPRRLGPFALTSAPFALYLCLHALHDRVEGHWPAPLYPALAVIAATAAEDARGAWRACRRLAPWVGFGAAAIALAFAALPGDPAPEVKDPALALRGWSAFAGTLDRRARGAGAGWIATMSYGVASELSAEPSLKLPVAEIVDRRRYLGLRLGPAPDFTRPGLLVDLPRRIDPQLLRRCFDSARPLGSAFRSGGDNDREVYAIWLLRGPRIGLEVRGCNGA